MTEPRLLDQMKGKEVHFRLVSNDLLEVGKPSITAVSTGASGDALLANASIAVQDYTQYPPEPLARALAAGLFGGAASSPSAEPGVIVVVSERDGSLSADDARYVAWLAAAKRQTPRVIMLPERGHGRDGAPSSGGERDSGVQAASFWPRQWRRFQALPAPITKDAALAAIPRTAIPVGISLFLALLKRAEVPLERAAGYIVLAFLFAVGCALFNQTILNWMTFWSDFTREASQPYVRRLETGSGSAPARWLTAALSFVSARGDVLIASPLMGVLFVYLARLALGPVGQTVSVLTPYGLLLVVINVLVGSIAGGPYTQAVAHLRAMGKITNRASMYLGIVETVKMELGRLADFGMQYLYNGAQLGLAVGFWLLLLVVDRCYPKPEIERLSRPEELVLISGLFEAFKERAGRHRATRHAFAGR